MISEIATTIREYNRKIQDLNEQAGRPDYSERINKVVETTNEKIRNIVSKHSEQ